MTRTIFDINKFSKRLRMLMEEHGLNTYTLANAVYLTPATISRYLNGKMEPKSGGAYTPCGFDSHLRRQGLRGFLEGFFYCPKPHKNRTKQKSGCGYNRSYISRSNSRCCSVISRGSSNSGNRLPSR